jgi:hypothetical protein
MANGTIAFDTLTTSDQVNTGTAKSIDTSYIFNGIPKQWSNYAGSGTTFRDSFNTASATDNGTGQDRQFAQIRAQATNSYGIQPIGDDGAQQDGGLNCSTVLGDLA